MCPGKRLGPVQRHEGDLKQQDTYPRLPTIPPNFPSRSMVLILSKLILKKIPPWDMMILLRVMIPVLSPMIYFTLLCIVLTCNFIKYSIKITSVLGIWTLNFPIPLDYSKLMGVFQRMREVDVSQRTKDLPEQHLILTQYILILWWMNFLTVLVHYLIQPWEVDQLMVMTNSLVDLGYTYSRYMMKKTPDIIVSAINLIDHTLELTLT